MLTRSMDLGASRGRWMARLPKQRIARARAAWKTKDPSERDPLETGVLQAQARPYDLHRLGISVIMPSCSTPESLMRETTLTKSP